MSPNLDHKQALLLNLLPNPVQFSLDPSLEESLARGGSQRANWGSVLGPDQLLSR
jgi:hypothetical protein